MYLPVDMKKNASLPGALIKSLGQAEHCYVIEDGNFNPGSGMKKLAAEEATKVVARLNGLNHVRIGTARMNPVAPHFGVSIAKDQHRAELIEYIGVDCGRDRTSRDILLLAELIFFEIKELEVLRVPIVCSWLDIPGISARIDSERGQTIFARQ